MTWIHQSLADTACVWEQQVAAATLLQELPT